MLAGGKARRMGGENKRLLKYGEKTFEEHILELFGRAGFERTYISVAKLPGKEGAEILETGNRPFREKAHPSDIVYIEDKDVGKGPMGGILSGLSCCKEEALFVIPCDMPKIPEDTVRTLLERYERERKPVFLKEEGKEILPFPGIYTKTLLPALENHMKTGDYRMRSLLLKMETKLSICPFPKDREGREAWEMPNINTRKDLQKLNKRNGMTIQEAFAALEKRIMEIREEERIPLGDSLGRVAAEEIRAGISQPPFARSPLDGYALRAGDTKGACEKAPVILKVTEKIYAGGFPKKEIRKGEAARIMTGAPLPDGADTVIRQEDTDYGEEQVKIKAEQKAYAFYCPEGEDFQKGDVLLKKGSILNAIRLGILAGAGAEKVKVKRKVRAAVFTTGSELAIPGAPLSPGQIYDSGLFLLTARLQELGVEIIRRAQLPDEEEALVSALSDTAGEADLIVTSGGVSVGEKDIVKPALRHAGAEILFERIMAKPGAPTTGAILCGKPVISLSGNPFGMMVHTELLVRKTLSCLTGSREFLPDEERGSFSGVYEKKNPVERYIRAHIRGGRVTVPGTKEKTGILSSMEGCNCLLRIPGGKDRIEDGEDVWVLRI